MDSKLELINKPSLLRKEVVTLAAAVDLYLRKAQRDNAPKTFKSYRDALFSFMRFAGTRDIISREPKEWMFEMVDVIEGWRKSMTLRSFSRSTIYSYDNKLAVFFNFLHRFDLITHNPYNLVGTRPVVATRRYPLFSAEEYEYMKERGLGRPRQYFLTVVGYNTGMSLVDCCTLEWPMVDLNRCMIIKVRKKTERFGDACQAHIPIKPSGDLYNLFLWMRDKWDSDRRVRPDYVFPQLSNDYLQCSQNIINTMSRFIQNRCGMEDRTFATFRRTWMSIMANSGANIALAMKMSGHTNADTFAKYVQPDLKVLHDTMHKAMGDAKTMKFSYDAALDGDDAPKFVKRRPSRPRGKPSEARPFGRTSSSEAYAACNRATPSNPAKAAIDRGDTSTPYPGAYDITPAPERARHSTRKSNGTFTPTTPTDTPDGSH